MLWSFSELQSIWPRAEWNAHMKEEIGTSFLLRRKKENLTFLLGCNYLNSPCLEREVVAEL